MKEPNCAPLPSLVLWESEARESVCCRIGLAGDFFPDEMTPPPGHTWEQLAGRVAPLFSDIAVAAVNLECPVGVEGLAPLPLAGWGSINSAPAESLDFLTPLRATVVGLANNHSYDYGEDGVQRTRTQISRRGMVSLGVGRNLEEAPEVFVWQSHENIRVGFWVAANITRTPATHNRRAVELATRKRASRALEEMRRHSVHSRVALLHAGLMRTHYPDPDDVRLLHEMAADGFDVVATCHSHRISGYTTTTQSTGMKTFCFHGLGSLLSGYCPARAEQEGLLVVVGLDGLGRLARVEVRPIYLDETGWPSALDALAGSAILERFANISRAMGDGSYSRRFYQDMNRNLLRYQIRDTIAAYRQAGLGAVARKASRLRRRHLLRLYYRIFG